MEYLVRLAPQVTFPRDQFLWDPGTIHNSSEYIHSSHCEHEIWSQLSNTSLPAPFVPEVRERDDTEAAEADIEEGTDGSVPRGGKPLRHGDDDGGDGEDAYDAEVGSPRHCVTVEAVVCPGYVAPHYQEADADIVQLVEDVTDTLAVTAQCVVGSGEAKTKDGTKEEETEDNLLAKLVPLEGRWGKSEEVGNEAKKDNDTDEMAPDIASLIVEADNTKEALSIAP